jgi:thiol-disulfide isomerase/thioredoxin
MQWFGMSAAWELALAIAVVLGLQFGVPAQSPQPDEVEAPAATAVTPGEVVPKQVAAGTAAILTPMTPTPVVLPEWLTQKITTRTALFYFSPTCPHCQDAMPDVRALVESGDMPWIGVATNQALTEEIASFKTEYQVPFELLKDDGDRGVGTPLDVRSFPAVYILAPPSADATHPPNTLMLQDVIVPFSKMAFSIRGDLANPFKDFDGYVGHSTCALCHTQEVQSWALTHHSLAYQTLYTREKATDPKCVSCHVTGLGEPGGFVMGDHHSEMRDVTCESCHGAGGPHGPGGAKVDAKAQCVKCHDAEHSIAFSVEKGLPHIDHFVANSLSMNEWRDRRIAMLQGEAPKPLLAFPEGPTVGSKACKSCHAASHESWSDSPHGRALGSLKMLERHDVACVRCHATPKAFGGPPPTEVSGYRVEESVGCESCHGAGGNHAASPSKDNIIGLGESCPECVIEAVCTTCHTQKWDPEWDLKTRLEAAKHP